MRRLLHRSGRGDHHLLIHNNWNITRDADGYWLTPALGTPEAKSQLTPTLSAALKDLPRERA